MTHAMFVLMDQELATLNRAVGVLRRHHRSIERMAVEPGDVPGLSRLTVILDANEATADLTVKKLRKLSGVRHAELSAVP